MKAPVMTTGSKVLDGGAIRHKARTVTWKATHTNTWKAWTQLSIDNCFGLVTGSRAKEGEEPSPTLMVS